MLCVIKDEEIVGSVIVEIISLMLDVAYDVVDTGWVMLNSEML